MEGVGLFRHDHARISAQLPGKLAMADIDGVDLRGAAIEQDVGETAGRRADIETDPPGRIDAETLDAMGQLQPAARDPGMVPAAHRQPSRPSLEPRRDSGAPASGRGSGPRPLLPCRPPSPREPRRCAVSTAASRHSHRSVAWKPGIAVNPLSHGANIQGTHPPGLGAGGHGLGRVRSLWCAAGLPTKAEARPDGAGAPGRRDIHDQ